MARSAASRVAVIADEFRALWEACDAQVAYQDWQTDELASICKLEFSAKNSVELLRLCVIDDVLYDNLDEHMSSLTVIRKRNPAASTLYIKINALLFATDFIDPQSCAPIEYCLSYFVEQVLADTYRSTLCEPAACLLHACTTQPGNDPEAIFLAVLHEKILRLGSTARDLALIQKQEIDSFVDLICDGGSPLNLLWSKEGKVINRLFK